MSGRERSIEKEDFSRQTLDVHRVQGMLQGVERQLTEM